MVIRQEMDDLGLFDSSVEPRLSVTGPGQVRGRTNSDHVARERSESRKRVKSAQKLSLRHHHSP